MPHDLLLAGVAAVVLTGAYLLAPKMGGDLSAQIARADFARHHPFAAVDFRWFGGTLPFGYSLWTPLVMAEIGVRVAGVIATVVSVVLFTALIARAGARRPLWGGLAAAVTLTSNLAEGRVTFATGIAFGLAALAALPRPERPHPALRRVASAALALIAAAASPVAGLFLLLCGGVLLLRRRRADAAAVATAAVPLAIIAGLFADGGRQVFAGNDAIRALLASALVVAFVPWRHGSIRIGGLIALVMVAVAFLAPTPVGSNSARLSLLFAVPLVAAFVTFDWWLALAAVALTVVVQTPVTFGTLTGAGRPVTRAAYFRPLAEEFTRLGPLTGRVEVPELTGHWDAAYLARDVPLARGWLRQTDTKLNDDVFYSHLPSATTYRAFLDRNAVQYVAVADARPTYFGRRELTLLKPGLPYLHEVWANEHWTLYAVTDPTPVVGAPATLDSYGADQIVLDAPAHTDVVLHLRWFDWLTVDGAGGCLRPGSDQQVVLHTGAAGRYRITSGLTSSSRRC